jgi:hypothetical protein
MAQPDKPTNPPVIPPEATPIEDVPESWQPKQATFKSRKALPKK